MVVLNKIYTRTGDGGETSLGDGTRVRKDCPRVSAYGAVDEANACFGLARGYADAHGDAEMVEAIARIQNDLFDLGADLCRPIPPESADKASKGLRISEKQINRLEAEIDALNESLEPLRSFILPGGSRLASALHLCRTVVRRTERDAIALAQYEALNSEALTYLNRLSDWCFCASRYANNNGADDILWTPGENN